MYLLHLIEKYEFDMVVLVSNQVEINSLADLADKRLCHPGFDENGWLYDWSNIFSEVIISFFNTA